MAITEQDEALYTEIVRRIVEAADPERIILFGSRARGNHRPDSDLDLFIEMETPDRPHERAVKIRSAFGLYRQPMDIVVYTPAEVQRLRGKFWTLLSEIESQGRVLYERG